jgi:hypothetical protein
VEGPAPDPPPTDEAKPASAERIEALLADLVLHEQPRGLYVYRRLAREPLEVVIPAIVSAAQRQTEWHRYARVVNLLGRFDDPRVLSALETEATRKNPFAVHAARALARMSVEGVEPVLFRLLTHKHVMIRRAAAKGLARRRVGRAVAPLCRLARRRRTGRPDSALIEALRSMGSVRDLFVYLLTDDSIDVRERVQAMIDLEEMHREFGRVNVMRILEREYADPRCKWGAQAMEAADLYYARRTLLRPSERQGNENLVRPASGPDRTPVEMLVRPSEAEAAGASAGSATEAGAAENAVQRVFRWIRDALDGD